MAKGEWEEDVDGLKLALCKAVLETQYVLIGPRLTWNPTKGEKNGVQMCKHKGYPQGGPACFSKVN